MRSFSFSIWFCCIASLAMFANAGELRVMSYNLWHGGDAGKQPIAQSVAVIKAAKADVVGLQETHGREAGKPRPDRSVEIATALGWYLVDQGGRTAIISRFPMGKLSPQKWGVRLTTPQGEIAVFNAHFPPAPYQPYQLLKIPYGNGRFITTEAEAIAEAKAARGANLARLIADIRTVTNGIPVFVTGDFNEPSHQDWTPAVTTAKRCPITVQWPTTKAVTGLGFVDGFRAAYPDPIKHPGRTWTTITDEGDPKDRHDRIDFVFVRGATVNDAKVVGEKKARANIVVDPYPSDHRAVVVVVELPE